MPATGPDIRDLIFTALGQVGVNLCKRRVTEMVCLGLHTWLQAHMFTESHVFRVQVLQLIVEILMFVDFNV